MTKILNRAIKLCGEQRIVGASKTSVRVLEYDNDGMIMRAMGITLPTNDDAGYTKGSLFIDTSSGVAYQNTGTSAACLFSTGVAGGDVTSVVAGAGMTGGGDSGAVTLNVINTDGKITVGANTIDITATSLVNADIATAAAIAYSKLAALASANILIGSAGNVATVTAITGDVALTNAGVTTVTDLTIASEAAGDILYFNGTNWIRLAKGTANYFLKMNAGATAPEWSVS